MLVKLSAEERASLRKPLGKIVSVDEVVDMHNKGKRIIVIGDASLLNLIRAGVKPFVAVFDFKTMRHPLSKEDVDLIKSLFADCLHVSNPPGHVNTELISVAEELMSRGGAICVDGEEDLVGLPFMLFLGKDDVIVYGIMNRGMVAVTFDECDLCKSIAERILSPYLKVKKDKNKE